MCVVRDLTDVKLNLRVKHKRTHSTCTMPWSLTTSVDAFYTLYNLCSRDGAVVRGPPVPRRSESLSMSEDNSKRKHGDSDSVIELNWHYEYKWKCKDIVDAETAAIDALSDDMLKKRCKGNVTQTPKAARNTFKNKLKSVGKRLINTGEPDEKAILNEGWFRDDINRLQLDLQKVLEADVANIDKVEFCRFEAGKTPLLF